MKTVLLCGKKAAGRVVVVDDEDYETVSRYRWWVMERELEGQRTRGPYAVATAWTTDRRRTLILMHQMLTGWPLTDHVDGDGLNNQRSNLRRATKVQNNVHSRSRLGSTSQYKGVHWAKAARAWRAAIGHCGKHVYLGSYSNEKDAAVAYDTAARELFGEFAVLNFPHIMGSLPMARAAGVAQAKSLATQGDATRGEEQERGGQLQKRVASRTGKAANALPGSGAQYLARITDEQIAEICQRHANDGVPFAVLAADYGITSSYAGMICRAGGRIRRARKP